MLQWFRRQQAHLREGFQTGQRSSRARRLLVNSGWLAGADGLGVIIGLATSVVLTRTLGVESFGIFSLVVTFATTVNQLTSFRMQEYVVKHIGDALGVDDKPGASVAAKLAFMVEGGASFLAFCLLIVIAPLGAELFVRVPSGTELIRLYAFVILANLVNESSAGILYAFHQFRHDSIIRTTGRIVNLAGITLVLVFNFGIFGVVLSQLLSNLVASGLLFGSALTVLHRRLGAKWWRTPFALTNARWRSDLHFVLNTNVSATISLVTRESDVLWLGLLRSPIEVGYYRLAASLSSMAFLPVRPLAQTIFPEITKEAAQQQWHRFERILRSSSYAISFYVIPAVIVLGVTSPFFIGALFGREFLPAVSAFVILMIGQGFAHIFIWNRPAMISLGLIGYATQIGLLTAVIKLLAPFVIVRAFGYNGNAMLMTMLYFLGVGLAVRKIKLELRSKSR